MTTFNLRDIQKHFDYIDHLWNTAKMSNYPPTDFIQHSENEFELVFAVAGFKKEDIEVLLDESILTVQCAKIQKVGDGESTEPEKKYLVRGISNKNFKRSIRLAPDAFVEAVKMSDGLLSIKINRRVTTTNPKSFEIE